MEALKQMKKTREPVTPEKFMEDLWAARRSLALIAAIELDVFSAIAEVKKPSADVARAIKAPRRGVERLLDAMVGLEYLARRGQSVWANAAVGYISGSQTPRLPRCDCGRESNSAPRLDATYRCDSDRAARGWSRYGSRT